MNYEFIGEIFGWVLVSIGLGYFIYVMHKITPKSKKHCD